MNIWQKAFEMKVHIFFIFSLLCLMPTFALSKPNPIKFSKGVKRVRRKTNHIRFGVRTNLKRYKHLWTHLFDTSHLRPNLRHDFGAMGKHNDADLDDLFKVSMGTQIARKHGDIAPLQSYLVFRSFDDTLIKSNTYRAQLLG